MARLIQLTEQVQVDPDYVTAVYASKEGTTIRFADGEALTISDDKNLVRLVTDLVNDNRSA